MHTKSIYLLPQFPLPIFMTRPIFCYRRRNEKLIFIKKDCNFHKNSRDNKINIVVINSEKKVFRKLLKLKDLIS